MSKEIAASAILYFEHPIDNLVKNIKGYFNPTY